MISLTGYTKLFFLLVILIMPLSNAYGSHHDCEKIRGALDIGSSSTKMTVAKVNVCTHTIKEILIKNKILEVDYRGDLEIPKSKPGFSKEIMLKGIEAINKLILLARLEIETHPDLNTNERSFEPEQLRGVATAAFRDAKNGEEFAEWISREIMVPVEVVPQKKEGVLGFLSVMTERPELRKEKTDLIVWDIGSKSMQITKCKEEPCNDLGDFEVYEGKLGSGEFKFRILKNIKNLKGEKKLNPLGEADREKAVQLAKDDTEKIQDSIKKNLEKNKVIGIGGTHNHLIKRKKVEKSEMTGGITKDCKIEKLKPDRNEKKEINIYLKDEVEKTLDCREKLDNDGLGGDKHSPTKASNAALVLGFMEGLKIDSVQPIDTNNSRGLLVYEGSWQ